MGLLSGPLGRILQWIRGSSRAVRSARAVYLPNARRSGSCLEKYLVVAPGSALPAQRYPFFDQIEIGRDEDGRAVVPGQLLLHGPRVSWRHCVITQMPDGRCFARDVSRNGTRVDNRRLVPNVETEIRVGQMLDLGSGIRFVLDGAAPLTTAETAAARKRTDAVPTHAFATVLFGDIRDYTVLVREAPAAELQQSVSRVFEHLTASVMEHGGTVKEYPGDAMLAFWEGTARGEQAVAACCAAVDLDRLTRRLAADPGVWSLKDYPLRMDWALATGDVVIDSFGGDGPVGLSMVGEPVVLASRLEKMANDETGPILLCGTTRRIVEQGRNASVDVPLRFLNLGAMRVKGFDRPTDVFAVEVPAS